MLMDIEAVEFFFFGDAEAYGFVDDGEYDDCHYEDVGYGGEYADYLGFEGVFWGEDSDEDTSCETAYAVDADGAYRVIDFGYFVEEFYGEYDEDASDESDDDCGVVADGIASGGDCYETGKGTVKGHGYVWFSVADPGYNKGCKCCGSSGKVGCHCDITEVCGSCCGRTAVETKPAEPEDEYAECCNRKVMSRNRTDFSIFVIFSNTRSEDFGTDKCADTADHMYSCGTGKIVESHLCEPAAAPDPVTCYRVNKNTDRCTI